MKSRKTLVASLVAGTVVAVGTQIAGDAVGHAIAPGYVQVVQAAAPVVAAAFAGIAAQRKSFAKSEDDLLNPGPDQEPW